jgi:hypothetical protein
VAMVMWKRKSTKIGDIFCALVGGCVKLSNLMNCMGLYITFLKAYSHCGYVIYGPNQFFFLVWVSIYYLVLL